MKAFNSLIGSIQGERETGLMQPSDLNSEKQWQVPDRLRNQGYAIWEVGQQEKEYRKLDELLIRPMMITSADRRKRLYTLIRSAVEANDASIVEPVVISNDRGLWNTILNNGDKRSITYQNGIFSPYQREAQELVVNLAAKVEQRKSGREKGPTFLLVIDDFGPFFGKQLDGDTEVYFQKLLEDGHNSSVLTVATAKMRSLRKLNENIFYSFNIVSF